jgi:hypothetical protein
MRQVAKAVNGGTFASPRGWKHVARMVPCRRQMAGGSLRMSPGRRLPAYTLCPTDHALRLPRARKAYDRLLTYWITEMMFGARQPAPGAQARSRSLVIPSCSAQ